MIDAQPRVTDPGTLLSMLPGALVLSTISLPAGLTGLAIDSRTVSPGGAFVALRGEKTDGHRFLQAAVERGAALLVVEAAWTLGDEARHEVEAFAHAERPIAVVSVPDTRVALGPLAALWYGRPAADLRIAGVTGTNGKTTTTHLLSAILDAAGEPCGRIGTLGAAFGTAAWSLENTTPPALELQALFAAMRDRGAKAVAMEVSSHALALDRVREVPFAVGALTNVTRDHLDFHGSFEAYAAAKRSLFDAAAVAVLNLDDPSGAAWAPEVARSRETITYAIDAPGATLRVRDVELGPSGSRFLLEGVRVHLGLPGRFNVANALAALACAKALGVDLGRAAQALENVRAVPGRMEHLGDGEIDVLVDYAHTPDALENVLRAAREAARARTIVVFGCGGDRDRGKRPQMGALARELADVAIVTSDNPRSENPKSIIDEIVAGAGPEALVEEDRGTAIRRAIALARPGDLVVVAGKGHETYQIVGAATLHFDDRDAVRAALAERARVAAP